MMRWFAVMATAGLLACATEMTTEDTAPTAAPIVEDPADEVPADDASDIDADDSSDDDSVPPDLVDVPVPSGGTSLSEFNAQVEIWRECDTDDDCVIANPPLECSCSLSIHEATVDDMTALASTVDCRGMVVSCLAPGPVFCNDLGLCDADWGGF